MIKLQQPEFTEPLNYREFDSIPLIVHARTEKVARDLVVLVHGLRGHRYGYWGQLPRFLIEDIANADLALYYYRTAWKRIGFGRSIDLEAEARVFADALRSLRGYRSITIIGHSMGGLLAKAAICDLLTRDRRQRTLRRLRGLVLIACPQLGSMRVPRLLKWLTTDGRALFPHNELISRVDVQFSSEIVVELDQDSPDRLPLPTWALIAAEDFWVDFLSGGIGVPNGQKRVFRGDHSSLIRPKNKGEDSYAYLKDCVGSSFGEYQSDKDYNITVDEAQPGDAFSIWNLAESHFGEGVTPENVIRQFIGRGGIFYVVRQVLTVEGNRKDVFTGYFCIIPLSTEAERLLCQGKLHGNEFGLEHLPGAGEPETTLYIGAIAARTNNSGAWLSEHLRHLLRYRLHMGARILLTRPLTKIGLRMVERSLFQPLDQPGIGQLYKVQASDLINDGRSRGSFAESANDPLRYH